MKKLLISFLFCWILVNVTEAKTTDSLFLFQQAQIIALEAKVHDFERQNASFDTHLKKLHEQVLSLVSENESLNSALQQKQASIDSLAKIVATNSSNIQTTADELGVKIQTTNDAVSQNADSLKTKTLWGIISVNLALLVSVVVALLLHKKGQKTSDDKIASLKKQADELNERIVGQFSNEMSELQRIGNALKNAEVTASAEPDHSLVKTLADRITFMEMTLYRMDSSVKGHKTLVTAIGNMKNNLRANGYEIVDMLGKQYDEGMSVNRVDYVDDDTLEKGVSIVTKVIKPQINYNGKMIQSAQIQVNQNL